MKLVSPRRAEGWSVDALMRSEVAEYARQHPRTEACILLCRDGTATVLAADCNWRAIHRALANQGLELGKDYIVSDGFVVGQGSTLKASAFAIWRLKRKIPGGWLADV